MDDKWWCCPLLVISDGTAVKVLKAVCSSFRSLALSPLHSGLLDKDLPVCLVSIVVLLL